MFRALAAGVGGAMLLTLTSCGGLGGGMTVKAEFTSAAGVFVGNDVGILGVPVGKVTAIDPKGDHVEITMQVDSGHDVPAGAAAVVVPRSVATDRYIELTPVFHQGDQKMRDGASIPLDRTQVPIEFDQVLGTVGNFADQISGNGDTANAISRLVAAQSEAFKGRGTLLNQAIHNIGSAVNGISAQRDNITSTLTGLDTLTGTLAQNQGTIKQFIQQVTTATSMLAAERDNFKSALEQSTAMIQTVAQFAQDNRAAITQAVSQANGVSQTILDKQAQVAEILRELPLATQNLQRAVAANGSLNVRLDATNLIPVIGPILQNLCSTSAAASPICTALGTSPTLAGITNLFSVLGL